MKIGVKRHMPAAVFLAVALALASACGLDKKIDEVLNPPEQSEKPVAIIGVDSEKVQVTSQVTLNATYSYDPLGKSMTYSWNLLEKPNGSSAALSSASDPIITFLTDKGGYYTVTLEITNESGKKSDMATVRIDAVGTGDNHPPVASAGSDQTVTVGDVAVLDATLSYDADGDSLSYQWALIDSPSGSAVDVVAQQVSRAFLYPDVKGTYTVRVRVSDGVDSDEDFVVVTASEASD